jgi:hypothetical protein
VWSSEASRGPFYRVERERELGFPEGCWREKFRGAAALATSLGHGGRSWVTRLLRGRAGVARWPRQRSARVRTGPVTGRQERRLFHRPWPRSGRAPVRDRQRRGLRRRRVHLRVRRSTAAASSTVDAIFWICAHRVFGQMPERNLNSKFWNQPPWVVKIFHKDSKSIFVLKKENVLQKFYFEIWIWSLFQIQTLADVWVGFWFEFLFEKPWLSK